jgi:hypothetical protein
MTAAMLLSAALAAGLPGVPPTTKTADVVDYIETVAPYTGSFRAWQLAKSITWAARHFGVEPLLLAAITRQESAFRPETKVCYIVARHHASFPTCDYGLTQVNQVWVDKWGLDAERLVNDDAYALFYGARVLAILQREYADDEPETWFSRYNTSSPGPRAQYEAALEPWLAAIETSH